LQGEAQPIVYANLLKSVQLLLEHFECEHENKEDCLCKSALEKVTKKLQLFGCETDELIHQFYVDRLRAQGDLCYDPLHGSLTIQCMFEENILKVNVMSGKNLVPPKTGRPTNIYAKVYLLPAHKFNSVKVPKTKAIKNSTFPMFDKEIEMYDSTTGSKVEIRVLH
jgi:C2 domain